MIALGIWNRRELSSPTLAIERWPTSGKTNVTVAFSTMLQPSRVTTIGNPDQTLWKATISVPIIWDAVFAVQSNATPPGSTGMDGRPYSEWRDG